MGTAASSGSAVRSAAVVASARRLVTEHGVRGFKSHPSSQAFEPDDARYYPLDFPVITPDRSLSDFAQLDVKDEVRPLIFKDNAARMLRLG